MPATESVFMKSANLHRQCELTDAQGNRTVVEPYAIFTSAKGRRCYRCYVISPAVDPNVGPWANPEVASVANVQMVEGTFQIRAAYDPFDKQLFPMMHFSLPTPDGRQRWADAQKNRDHQTLKTHDGGY
jgi:hypothetical protein